MVKKKTWANSPLGPGPWAQQNLTKMSVTDVGRHQYEMGTDVPYRDVTAEVQGPNRSRAQFRVRSPLPANQKTIAPQED